MVNLFKRMRTLKTLLNIRVGTGAAVFPSAATATKEFPAITRLHLTYARKIYGGHQGARHFWRNCLPRLKYYNPAVQMTVKQTTEQEGPAALTIYFSENLSSPASLNAAKIEDKYAPQPAATEKAAVVELNNLDYKEIWDKVKMMTGAQEMTATAEDEAELKKLEQMRLQADKDRERVRKALEAKKHQEMMLKAARGEIEMMKQS